MVASRVIGCPSGAFFLPGGNLLQNAHMQSGVLHGFFGGAAIESVDQEKNPAEAERGWSARSMMLLLRRRNALAQFVYGIVEMTDCILEALLDRSNSIIGVHRRVHRRVQAKPPCSTRA